MNETYEYIIITVSNYSDSQLSEFDSHCVNYSAYARCNNDGTKKILKLATNKPTPDCFLSITRYNKTEIETVLGTTEWKTSNSNKVDSQIDTINSNDIANTPNSEL